MTMRSWIRNLFVRPKTRTIRRAPHRTRLALEALEDRTVPTTFTVTNTNDSGSGSLRDAIVQAQSGAKVGVADAIVFNDGTLPGTNFSDGTAHTITLSTGQLILADTATTTITGPGADLLSINGNNASSVFAISSGKKAALSDLTITGGSSAKGGGVDNLGTVTLTGCTVTNNAAGTSGGGVFSSGSLTLTSCTLTNNTAGKSGGGVLTSGTATLLNCTISGNTATTYKGGGVYTPSGTTTLDGVTLSNNHANYRGGGFGNQNGIASLTNCTISGNSLNADSGSGGAGVFNRDNTTTLTNCTISGNTAVGAFTAAGVFNVNGTVALLGCTVSGNIGGGHYSSTGVGIFNLSATPISLSNTIVAGNVGHGDVFGPISSLGSNLIGNIGTSTGWIAGSDLTGTSAVPLDPLLGPLADNGGPTQTMALLAGSPALNAGNPATAPATDQRGLPRFANTDIGAFEHQFKVTNTNDSGPGSLRQAVLNANATTGANTIIFTSLFNTAQTITLTTGELLLTDTDTTTISGPGANLLSISGNSSSRVFTTTNAALSGLTITGGQATYGAGLYNLGTTTLTSCTVSGNTADAAGGLYNNLQGTLTLASCTLRDNTATVGAGGGVSNFGTLNMTNSTVSGNSAALEGGGVYNNGSSGGTTTLTSCTVSGNTSTYPFLGTPSGGGLFNGGSPANGTMTLINCTISGNSATLTGGGGGVGNKGTLNMINCTVSGNSAQYGGGLANHGGTANLANTIVAGNTAGSGPDASGSFASQGTNLIGETDGSTGWVVGSDLTGTVAMPKDPGLGVLANNGGPTETMALLPGSPAIDAGSNALAPAGTDQRGFPRIINGVVDIGAFEVLSFDSLLSMLPGGAGSTLGSFIDQANDAAAANDIPGAKAALDSFIAGAVAAVVANTFDLTTGENLLQAAGAIETALGVGLPPALAQNAPVLFQNFDYLLRNVPGGVGGALGSFVGQAAAALAQGDVAQTQTALNSFIGGAVAAVGAGALDLTSGENFLQAAGAIETTLGVGLSPALAQNAPVLFQNFDYLLRNVPGGVGGALGSFVGQAAAALAQGDVAQTQTALNSFIGGAVAAVGAGALDLTTGENFLQAAGAIETTLGVGLSPALAQQAPELFQNFDDMLRSVPGGVAGALGSFIGQAAVTLAQGDVASTVTALNSFISAAVTAAATVGGGLDLKTLLQLLTAAGNIEPILGALAPSSGSYFILSPKAKAALKLSGNASIQTISQIVVNSLSPKAVSAGGQAQVSAGSGVRVAGGVQVGPKAAVPSPSTPPPAFLGDPLAGLPAPSVADFPAVASLTHGAAPSAVVPKNFGAVRLSTGSVTLQPGIYTKIALSGNAQVTFAPGVYIIAGGGFSMSGIASATGKGVMIYNAGSKWLTGQSGGTFGAITISSKATCNLSAPTSGTYAGILFFQARDNKTAITLSSTTPMDLSGAMYAPVASMTLKGEADVRQDTLVVAKLTLSNEAEAL